jgi:hypothetical protein
LTWSENLQADRLTPKATIQNILSILLTVYNSSLK